MSAMVRVSGRVRFDADAFKVYVYLARTVLAHAVDRQSDDSISTATTILTRYETRLGPLKINTTEEATLAPGQSITWRHVDGPLTGSLERFRIQVAGGGGALALYEAEIRARNKLLRGPLEWLLVVPLTRMVSMKALKEARKSLEGERRPETGVPPA